MRIFWSLTGCSLLLLPAAAYAQDTITVGVEADTVCSAGPGSTDYVSVTANISSSYAIQEAQLQVGTVTASMSLSANSGGTIAGGGIDVSSLPFGTMETATVTVTDIYGNTGTGSGTFVRHQVPILDVYAPGAYTLANPNLTVVSTCTAFDIGNCVSMTASMQAVNRPGSQVLFAVDGGTLDGSVSLASEAATAQEYTVTVQANDQLCPASTTYSVPVFADDAPLLQQVDQVAGQIVAFDPWRIAYVDGVGQLFVSSRITGQSQLVSTGSNAVSTVPLLPQVAFFDGGALFIASGGLFQWNGQDTAELVTCPYSGDFVATASDRAFWECNGCGYEELATSSVQSTICYGGAYPQSMDPAGNVFTGLNSDLISVSFADGGYATIPTSNPVWSAVTDGTILAYLSSSSSGPIYLPGVGPDGGDLLVGPLLAPYEGDYPIRANGGRIAFNQSISSVSQVVVADTAGTVTQVSPFLTDSAIDWLAPNGQLTFFNPADYVGQPSPPAERYLSVEESSPPIRISGPAGVALWLDGGWYVAIGGALECVILDGGTCTPDSAWQQGSTSSTTGASTSTSSGAAGATAAASSSGGGTGATSASGSNSSTTSISSSGANSSSSTNGGASTSSGNATAGATGASGVTSSSGDMATSTISGVTATSSSGTGAGSAAATSAGNAGSTGATTGTTPVSSGCSSGAGEAQAVVTALVLLRLIRRRRLVPQ